MAKRGYLSTYSAREQRYARSGIPGLAPMTRGMHLRAGTRLAGMALAAILLCFVFPWWIVAPAFYALLRLIGALAGDGAARGGAQAWERFQAEYPDSIGKRRGGGDV
mgnify:FL=1